MLTMNIGFSKKIGEANYGSRGASVSLELELDSSLIGDPERLKERIRHLFGLARTSVEEELVGPSPGGPQDPPESNGNGHAPARRRDGTRKATASQARALHVIADRRAINLATLLRQRYGVDTAGDLSITEASGLIDELKSATNGNGHGAKR